MRTSNIFNAANKLNSYSVSIDGLSLTNETIISLEISYSNRTCKVLANLYVKDMYDLNLHLDWKTASVSISYTDIFSETVDKSFKVMSVTEGTTGNDDKTLSLELQDEFSYTFETSYLSKGFKANVIDAFNAYITELGLDSYEKEIPGGSGSYEFVVPAHENNLVFFEKEFAKKGYAIYQTKEKIIVKPLKDLSPSKFEDNDPGKPYTDETDNQLYKNKIYDMAPSHAKRVNIPQKTKVLAYDPLSKAAKEAEANTISDLLLNDDTSNMQETKGKREVLQQHLEFDDHKLQMREKFMAASELMIVVNGYVKNDLNQVYSLKLKGIKGSSESQNKANAVLNGKWVSYKIVDKIVGDSLVQKIELKRADESKP